MPSLGAHSLSSWECADSVDFRSLRHGSIIVTMLLGCDFVDFCCKDNGGQPRLLDDAHEQPSRDPCKERGEQDSPYHVL